MERKVWTFVGSTTPADEDIHPTLGFHKIVSYFRPLDLCGSEVGLIVSEERSGAPIQYFSYDGKVRRRIGGFSFPPDSAGFSIAPRVLLDDQETLIIGAGETVYFIRKNVYFDVIYNDLHSRSILDSAQKIVPGRMSGEVKDKDKDNAPVVGKLDRVAGLAHDPIAQLLYISEYEDYKQYHMRVVNLKTKSVSTLATIPAINSYNVVLWYPNGITLYTDGSVLFPDQVNHCIRRITLDGRKTVFAGSCERGYKDGPIHEAQFYRPCSIVVDKRDGCVYISEAYPVLAVRKIWPHGYVTTIVGGPDSTDFYPTGLFLRPDGFLFIANYDINGRGTILGMDVSDISLPYDPFPISFHAEHLTHDLESMFSRNQSEIDLSDLSLTSSLSRVDKILPCKRKTSC